MSDQSPNLRVIPAAACECFICHERPGTPVVFDTGVRLVCDSCTIPASLWMERGPEQELYCPVCRRDSIVFSFSAIEPFNEEEPEYNIKLPYSAICSGCDSFLITSHPTPEAALAHWRNYASTL